MTHAEMCRHAAIVGELACAVANPSKRRHFYLATKSEFILSGVILLALLLLLHIRVY